jgi:2-polyprenyl-6-methoxyphenol hydroxylase-like FAD-dependent oxidoreductase
MHIVVVGGSAAGSLSALMLARAGHDVVVVDRHGRTRGNRVPRRTRIPRRRCSAPHHPVGGTGMNTAIHAAHNLGWKLRAEERRF